MLIGHTHTLRVARFSAQTLWLQKTDATANDPAHDTHPTSNAHVWGGNPEVPLARSDAPDAQLGSELVVFVHHDGEGKPLASVQLPSVELDQCACLRVTDVGEAGAFLDWGLSKELLLPYAEQRRPVKPGMRESVLVYTDNSGRLAATSRLDLHLGESAGGFTPWQTVSLLLYQRTDLGFKAVIDDRAIGLIYRDEIFSDVRTGSRVKGYVKRIRSDGRIDLSLQPRRHDLAPDLCEAVLLHLAAQGGRSTLTDKSSPDAIQDTFGVSKKNYKRALASLYKQRRIIIEPDHVRLVSE